jgi:hypothetical protein
VYPAVLRDVSVQEGRTAPYWRWQYELGGDARGRTMFDNTSLSDRALWRLKGVFDAFGVPADTDTEELIGKPVQLVVDQETQQEGAGAGTIRNVVRDVRPAKQDSGPVEVQNRVSNDAGF